MSAPHVTIKVKGSVTGDTDIETLTKSLYMTYFQAVEGDRRHQWTVFPPAVETLGVDSQKVAASLGRIRVLHRTQEFKGNRCKWFHQDRDPSFLLEALEECKNKSMIITGPVVVPLELDDYLVVWNDDDTPHKAFRAVDRTIKRVLGTTVK